jgi:hypothetical protein
MRKKKGRTKPFEVFGRFEIQGEGHIETWSGHAKSAAAAVRRAVLALWKRPAVRWKHVQSANFLIRPTAKEGAIVKAANKKR